MSRLRQHLTSIDNEPDRAQLGQIRRGLEKESLRVSEAGTLALTPHHRQLGSPLTHPAITTDFSEALLELITAPRRGAEATLEELDEIHRYVYRVLEEEGEYLWVNSMPCVLTQDDEIPVARYGSSNPARMKTIYRQGLSHRYGALMQTIAGIHYNFSLDDAFWQFLRAQEGSRLDLQAYKTQRYFDLIRNFRRYFWLLLYLFGAAPAICPTFVQGRKHALIPLDGDRGTLHAPYATSLRMGDLGYQSEAQKSLHVDYNNLPDYLAALCRAITQPHDDYAAIGTTDGNGQYRQLNTGILQIENEFYGPIRPKRSARSGEAALRALHDRGVEYVEVRCMDLDPYHPLGIGEEQIAFLDNFLLYCLLADSGPSDQKESERLAVNQERMVYQGRDPELQLLGPGGERPFRPWARELLTELDDVAGLLDRAHGSTRHAWANTRQWAKLENPQLTPSAQILADLRQNGQSFYQFGLRQTLQHAEYFRRRPLQGERRRHYEQVCAESLQQQAALEARNQPPFSEYLAGFYAQYQRCAECGPT